MKKRKQIGFSEGLCRQFYVDVFEPRSVPSGVVIFFGGSGKTRPEYERRMGLPPNPAFDPVWHRLPDLDLVCLYVTAPYDIPYADPERFEAH